MERRYLTVVPGISSTLEDPAYGSDDTEDTCDPMTAIEDTDRLDYTRGSGARTDMVGRLVRIWTVSQIYLGIPRILKIGDQGAGRGGRETNRTCKQRRAGAIRRRRNRCLGKQSGTVTVAVRIGRTVIQCLFLYGNAVSRREGRTKHGTDVPSCNRCRWV